MIVRCVDPADLEEFLTYGALYVAERGACQTLSVRVAGRWLHFASDRFVGIR